MEQAQPPAQNCIFCSIIEGKIPSKKVYEDELFIGILDINPAAPGHVLIMPKQHHMLIPVMPDAGKMMNAAKRVSRAMIRVLQAGGTNIFAANGGAAGQKAPHAILHVIPRYGNDGIEVFKLIKNEVTPEDQEKLRSAISAQLSAGEKSTAPQENKQPPPAQMPATEIPAGIKKNSTLDAISNMFNK